MNMLRGLLLCGGQSSRMQTDKGLLKFNGITWAELAYNKLVELGIPVEISINKNQQAYYNEIFVSRNFIVDNEKIDVRGPLLGIVSTHLSYPNDDLLVITTDMPLLKSATFEQLIQTYKNQKHQIYVFEALNHIQPLCGIYTKEALEKLINIETTNYSLKAYLDKMSTFYLKASDEQALEFQNFNTPDELTSLNID